MTEQIITAFAAIGATVTAALLCWVAAGIWVKVFPR